ncbi:MAG: penicillin-binding protein 2 [Candidatus Parcubacteria bacterium]|jgi:penicillin-binding protein 2|nr:MAG: penicillin-binding protein 2 [Candidatus Parcubacteria bacterium]
MRFLRHRFQNKKKGSRDGNNPFVTQEGEYSFGQLEDNYYYSDWTERSFLADSGSKEFVGQTFDFARLPIIAIALIIFFSILAGRSFWLQVVKGDYYYSLAEGNRLRTETVEARRGIIYDRNLVQLVNNAANFVLYLRPIELPRDEETRDQLIRRLAYWLDGDLETLSRGEDDIPTEQLGDLTLVKDYPSYFLIKNLLDEVVIGSLESYQPLFVKDNLDYDRALLLALKLPEAPGVFLSNKIRREYIFPLQSASSEETITSLSHILGYTGKINRAELEKWGDDYSLIDYLGKTGLEASWEKELRGVSGQKNIEVDALGRQKKIISETPAQDGASLQLSLDVALQGYAEEVLSKHLETMNLRRGAVVALNPRNGEVLALVSLPSYDNRLFATGISQGDYDKYLNDPDRPLLNRAISGGFPSGSTFKIVVAAAALQEKIINTATSFLSTGGLQVGQWFFPDWRSGGHGTTNVKKAIADSVNTFFYYIGGGYDNFTGLGIDRLGKYAQLFGLSEVSGLDLPGEAPGFFPSADWKLEAKKERWYIGDTYHVSIGQGDVVVTPLQVANYTATIANGGRFYKPHLVSALLNSNNEVTKNIEPSIIRQDFIDDNNLEIVREGMRQAVTVGSARSLQVVPVPVAAKTGTAQWSTQKEPHAWFTSFAPYEEPSIVLTVLVEEGKEGSAVGAAVAREILTWYFSEHLPPASTSD